MRRNVRVSTALGIAALLVTSSGSADQPRVPSDGKATVAQAAPRGGSAPKRGTWRVLTGEIVDMGCYTSRGLKGPAHHDCGIQCARSGIPRGLLTPGDTVYVLTQNHDRAMAPTNFPPPDPFALCTDWMSLQVEVSGLVWEGKDSARFLEVRAAKLAPPAAAP